MKKKILLLFPVFMIFWMAGFTQTDLTLYNMRNIPQVVYTNPAMVPYSRVNIGLPGISSIYGNAFNSGFAYKHIVHPDGDSLMLDPDLMIKKMADRNFIGAHLAIDVVHVGFKAGKNYIHANWTEKGYGRFTLPRDLVTLAWRGNAAFLQQTADLSGVGMDAAHYHEFAFGWSRPIIEDKLTIGGTAKLLMGTYNVTTKQNNLGLFTDSTTYFLTLTSDIDVNTSGLPNFLDNDTTQTDTGGFHPEARDFMFSHGNTGLALDLGATYKINDKFSVSASLLDLGYIHWKYMPVNYRNTNSTFTFEGLEVDSIPQSGDSTNWGEYLDSIATATLDSLSAKLDIDTTSEAYNSHLPTRFYLSGTYNITPKITAGLLFHGEFYRKTFRPAFSASITARAGRWFQASLNYSYLNRSFQNIGMGFAINGGPVQLYVLTDNILAPLAPHATRTAHFHMGINLTFGREQLDRDHDGIKDKEDMCPDDPGLPEFAGCPDRDGDKIIDKDDACPDVPGVPLFSGCPDTDNDQVVDSLDACPLEAGVIELGGCPDRDHDKIIDKEDACPDEAGPLNTKGCPDRDGDLVIDREDLCPDKPGLPEHKGCPDTDGDGLYDNEDLCPEKFGPMDNKGCPYGDLDGDGTFDKDDRCVDTPGPKENKGCPFGDIDGDGVLDPQDSCPKTPGPKENNGCPIIEKKDQEIINTAFSNLEFESGKAIIRPTSYPSLDSLASLLVRKKDWRIRISGHTDDVGADAANMTLSKNRANAVKEYLNSRGINSDDKFVVEWYGETKPLCKELTPVCRQKNRRVEFEIIFE